MKAFIFALTAALTAGIMLVNGIWTGFWISIAVAVALGFYNLQDWTDKPLLPP